MLKVLLVPFKVPLVSLKVLLASIFMPEVHQHLIMLVTIILEIVVTNYKCILQFGRKFDVFLKGRKSVKADWILRI